MSCYLDWREASPEMIDELVEGLPEDHRSAFLGGNARDLCAIDA